MNCPCELAGNPRAHGVMCHYAGIVATPCTQLPYSSGLSTVVVHDKRGCFAVCPAHAAWRATTSMMPGHAKWCPEATKT